MPNSPRGAPQGARIPQRILLGGSKILREVGSGVPKTGEAKFPMTPVLRWYGLEQNKRVDQLDAKTKGSTLFRNPRALSSALATLGSPQAGVLGF